MMKDPDRACRVAREHDTACETPLVLSSPDGARAVRIVPLEGAKAVLMVRSFQDDRERPDHCTWDSRRRTRPGVVLEFKDGERIFGYTIGPPKVGTRGFHVFPADAAGNLTRLYVFWDALRSVELVPAEDGGPQDPAGTGDIE